VGFLVVTKGIPEPPPQLEVHDILYIQQMADFHVGHIIKAVFDEQGRTVKWFAEKMCCNRTNIHKIFEKQHLNSETIARASQVLGHDFFLDISKLINE